MKKLIFLTFKKKWMPTNSLINNYILYQQIIIFGTIFCNKIESIINIIIIIIINDYIKNFVNKIKDKIKY